MNGDRLSSFFALLSAGAAAVSCYYAVQQTKIAREIPFRSALYGSRANALSDFVRASAVFQATLQRARIDAPYAVTDPSVLNSLTDQQMTEVATSVAPVIAAHGAYMASVNSDLPFWSNETRAEIGASIIASKPAADCYVLLSSHARKMPNSYWRDIKRISQVSCQSQAAALKSFIATIASAEAAMIAELGRTGTDDIPPGTGNAADGLD